MDGACLGCLDVAWKKAKNSILTGQPSSALGKLSNPSPTWQDCPLFRVEHTNDGLITFGGGVPIIDPVTGALLGALGSSSGSVQEDEAVSGAGAAAAVSGGTPPYAIPATSNQFQCSLSLEFTYKGLAAAKNASDLLKIAYNLAIQDNFGRMKGFRRMDDAPLASLDVAIRKSTSTAVFGNPTDVFYNATQPGAVVYSIEVTNGGLVVFGGGLPITRGGELVGSIRTSAGSVAQDILVSNAAVAVASAANCGPASPSSDSTVKVWVAAVVAIATFFAGIFAVVAYGKLTGRSSLHTQDSDALLHH